MIVTIIVIVAVVVVVAVLVPTVAIVSGGAKVADTRACSAGEWTSIVRNVGTVLPRSITVEIDDTEPVRGRWREVRQRSILRDESVAGDIETSMAFGRRWLDWRYRIEIRPDRDISVTIT
ncbi:MAG: hypothetical protein R2823_04260 [Acidimicrobiia bacterium]